MRRREVFGPQLFRRESEAVVYRMRDAEGILLYAGMTTNLPQRLTSHRYTQGWWPQVACVEVQHFDSRCEASREEGRAIAEEHPLHNRQPGHGVAFDTLAEKLVAENRPATPYDPKVGIR
jgi:predicted GIY-YIG superfamily endonuclease